MAGDGSIGNRPDAFVGVRHDHGIRIGEGRNHIRCWSHAESARDALEASRAASDYDLIVFFHPKDLVAVRSGKGSAPSESTGRKI